MAKRRKADLTEAEREILTCNLCSNPADRVSVCPGYNGHIVSLCAVCIRDMYDALETRH